MSSRGRGRKRGPYCTYEFERGRHVVPKSTAYGAHKQPPSKKRRESHEQERDHSSSTAGTSAYTSPSSSREPCSKWVEDSSHRSDVVQCDMPCDEPCGLQHDVQQPFESISDEPSDTPGGQGSPLTPDCRDSPQVIAPTVPQDLQEGWQFVDDNFHQSPEQSIEELEEEEPEEESQHSFDEQTQVSELPATDDPPDDSEDDDESNLAGGADLALSVPAKIRVLLLLATKFRHKLTYAAAECIMKLAGVCSKDSSLSFSKHTLKSAINSYSSPASEHHICPTCSCYVGKVSEESVECPTCSSEINTKVNIKSGNVFLYIPLAEQIKSLLIHSRLLDEIIKPNNRSKINRGNYEDIYDGMIYKSSVGPNCISFNFFVDGLQVRTTSKTAAWPVLVCINELPLHLRRKHILMASVWLGKKKPKFMNEYLRPFVRECIELERDGISFKYNGVTIHLRVIPLMCVSDSVARPTLRNSTQFNGQYGCGLCYHPGYAMQRGRGHCRSYSIAERTFPYRTHAETLENARNAEATGEPQQGIKGHSILSDIPGFDIVHCLDLDMFHALVNCAKRFTNLWLSKRYKSQPFSVYSKFHQVDRRLMSITPTNSVSRNPRSLSERSDYRGHEWFSWVIFYSVPVLTGILPKRYLSHWSRLVNGIVLLMQNSVSKADVVYADRFLHQFNREIDALYGSQHVTFSTHLLTHLAQSTKNFGQPWAHSAFVFENFNGEIKAIVKSSNGISHQIVKHMQLRIALKIMQSELNYAMSDAEKDFLMSVMCSSKGLADPYLTIGEVSFLGEPKSILLSATLREVFLRNGFHPVEGKEYVMFDRCVLNNEIFQSVNYSRVEKQNNSIVSLKSDQVFEVHSFVVLENVPVALGPFLVRNRAQLCDVNLPHIRLFNVECEENLRCVSVFDFESKLLSFSLKISREQSVRFTLVNVLEMEMLH